MKIQAHRGASAYAPENTLEAFSLAHEMHADGVELDVHLTRDGEVVVTHDDRIDRVSDGSGRVSDFTLAELKKFDFGRLFPDQYAGARIPTLAEVYALLAPTGMTVNVELKTSPNPYFGIEEKCLEIAARAGMSDKVMYSSFNFISLHNIRTLDPSVRIGLLYSQPMLDTPGFASKQQANAIHPYYKLMHEPGIIQRMHDRGILVHVWTVDDPEEIRFFRENLADAIITNAPDRG